MNKTYVIKVEGQDIPVPEDVGALDDADLKRALTPMFPGAANSRIERAEQDGVVTITVTKLAGAKGKGRRKKGGGFAALVACRSRRNPTVERYIQLHAEDAGDLDPDRLVVLAAAIDKALESGQRQYDELVAAHARLLRTAAREGRDFVPLGF